VVAHTCNTSTWEVVAEGSQVQVQPGLHSETPSQKPSPHQPKQTINLKQNKTHQENKQKSKDLALNLLDQKKKKSQALFVPTSYLSEYILYFFYRLKCRA
jgi:hypothetical protein